MSSFHSVFKRLVLQTCKNQGLFGKGLIEHNYVVIFAQEFLSAKEVGTLFNGLNISDVKSLSNTELEDMLPMLRNMDLPFHLGNIIVKKVIVYVPFDALVFEIIPLMHNTDF